VARPEIGQGIKRKTDGMVIFQEILQEKYLSESYYERKTKEFYELRLGQMTMDDLINKFLELLRFVPYIKEDKVKIQQFLSCLPQSYKDIIEFDNPKNLSKYLERLECAMISTNRGLKFPRHGRIRNKTE
jgi:hypothetical protein